MKSTECTRNIENCKLKGLLTELALNRDDDNEQRNNEEWDRVFAEAVENGDEFFNYDGPAHTWGDKTSAV